MIDLCMMAKIFCGFPNLKNLIDLSSEKLKACGVKVTILEHLDATWQTFKVDSNMF
jgi:hypothetical protein